MQSTVQEYCRHYLSTGNMLLLCQGNDQNLHQKCRPIVHTGVGIYNLHHEPAEIFHHLYHLPHKLKNTGRDVAATSLEVFIGLSSIDIEGLLNRVKSEVNQDINHYEVEYDNRGGA